MEERFKDTKKMLITVSILVVAVISLSLVNPGSALDVTDTESANISVTISTRTMVNIDPYVLSWSGLEPGGIGNSSYEANGYFALQIENIGSHNITNIWFNSTYPGSNPFGTADSSSYDAGNFVVLARENLSVVPGGATASYCEGLGKYTDYKYPNRVEYPELRSIVYLKDPSGNMPPQNMDYGRVRFANEEYFWMVPNNTDCDGQNFYLGKEPHTETQTGSVDFSVGANYVSGALTTSGDWCYWTVTGHDELTDYGVLVQNGTSGTSRKFMFVWWNKDALSAGTVGQYLLGGNNLVPGNSTAACIKTYIPYGVYEGQVNTGTLTVVVNSA